MNLALVVTAFLLIFPVELPDKTFVATLVLATKYRPLAVWIGVCAAFAVQTLIAVTLGGAIGRLPTTPVSIATAALFLIGGFVLLRGAAAADEEEAEVEAEFEAKATSTASGFRAVIPSFLILFMAEWGDLSQLLTASLAARHQDPVSIGLGAFLALAMVSGLGAALGKQLLRRLKLSTIRRVGGIVCLLMAAATFASVLGLDLPVLG